MRIHAGEGKEYAHHVAEFADARIFEYFFGQEIDQYFGIGLRKFVRYRRHGRWRSGQVVEQ